MNKLKTRIYALLLACCLVSMNLVSVVSAAEASVNKTVPSVAEVQTEAQATAKYLLDTDFKSLDLSDTSLFKTVSKDLILAIRSGLDCSVYVEKYITEVTTKYAAADGTIKVALNSSSYYTNDTLSVYAYYIEVLTLSDKDASLYVKKLDELLNAATVEELTITSYDNASYTYGGYTYSYEYGIGGLNPYLLSVIYSTVESYGTAFVHYSSISEKLVKALLASTLNRDNGFYYAGYSPDNDGAVLPSFHAAYKTNADVKKLIDTSIEYAVKTFTTADGGFDGYAYESNVDSTGLGLALMAEYGKSDEAAAAYNALLKLKSSTTAGAYTYGGYDNEYGTHDALQGLVTYLCVLQGKSNPFDVSYKLVKNNTDNIEPENQTEGEKQTVAEAVTSAGNESAQTGDVNIYIYAAMALLSLGTVATAIYRKRCAK